MARDNVVYAELRTTPKARGSNSATRAALPVPAARPHQRSARGATPLRLHLHMACSCRRTAPLLAMQARPEQGMTKESYLDAVYRGIADYYAESRRPNGALPACRGAMQGTAACEGGGGGEGGVGGGGGGAGVL
jgi:hypothetical protein